MMFHKIFLLLLLHQENVENSLSQPTVPTNVQVKPLGDAKVQVSWSPSNLVSDDALPPPLPATLVWSKYSFADNPSVTIEEDSRAVAGDQFENTELILLCKGRPRPQCGLFGRTDTNTKEKDVETRYGYEWVTPDPSANDKLLGNIASDGTTNQQSKKINKVWMRMNVESQGVTSASIEAATVSSKYALVCFTVEATQSVDCTVVTRTGNAIEQSNILNVGEFANSFGDSTVMEYAETIAMKSYKMSEEEEVSTESPGTAFGVVCWHLKMDTAQPSLAHTQCSALFYDGTVLTQQTNPTAGPGGTGLSLATFSPDKSSLLCYVKSRAKLDNFVTSLPVTCGALSYDAHAKKVIYYDFASNINPFQSSSCVWGTSGNCNSAIWNIRLSSFDVNPVEKIKNAILCHSHKYNSDFEFIDCVVLTLSEPFEPPTFGSSMTVPANTRGYVAVSTLDSNRAVVCYGSVSTTAAASSQQCSAILRSGQEIAVGQEIIFKEMYVTGSSQHTYTAVVRYGRDNVVVYCGTIHEELIGTFVTAQTSAPFTQRGLVALETSVPISLVSQTISQIDCVRMVTLGNQPSTDWYGVACWRHENSGVRCQKVIACPWKSSCTTSRPTGAQFALESGNSWFIDLKAFKDLQGIDYAILCYSNYAQSKSLMCKVIGSEDVPYGLANHRSPPTWNGEANVAYISIATMTYDVAIVCYLKTVANEGVCTALVRAHNFGSSNYILTKMSVEKCFVCQGADFSAMAVASFQNPNRIDMFTNKYGRGGTGLVCYGGKDETSNAPVVACRGMVVSYVNQGGLFGAGAFDMGSNQIVMWTGKPGTQSIAVAAFDYESAVVCSNINGVQFTKCAVVFSTFSHLIRGNDLDDFTLSYKSQYPTLATLGVKKRSGFVDGSETRVTNRNRQRSDEVILCDRMGFAGRDSSHCMTLQRRGMKLYKGDEAEFDDMGRGIGPPAVWDVGKITLCGFAKLGAGWQVVCTHLGQDLFFRAQHVNQQDQDERDSFEYSITRFKTITPITSSGSNMIAAICYAGKTLPAAYDGQAVNVIKLRCAVMEKFVSQKQIGGANGYERKVNLRKNGYQFHHLNPSCDEVVSFPGNQVEVVFRWTIDAINHERLLICAEWHQYPQAISKKLSCWPVELNVDRDNSCSGLNLNQPVVINEGRTQKSVVTILPKLVKNSRAEITHQSNRFIACFRDHATKKGICRGRTLVKPNLIQIETFDGVLDFEFAATTDANMNLIVKGGTENDAVLCWLESTMKCQTIQWNPAVAPAVAFSSVLEFSTGGSYEASRSSSSGATSSWVDINKQGSSMSIAHVSGFDNTDPSNNAQIYILCFAGNNDLPSCVGLRRHLNTLVKGDILTLSTLGRVGFPHDTPTIAADATANQATVCYSDFGFSKYGRCTTLTISGLTLVEKESKIFRHAPGDMNKMIQHRNFAHEGFESTIDALVCWRTTMMEQRIDTPRLDYEIRCKDFAFPGTGDPTDGGPAPASFVKYSIDVQAVGATDWQAVNEETELSTSSTVLSDMSAGSYLARVQATDTAGTAVSDPSLSVEACQAYVLGGDVGGTQCEPICLPGYSLKENTTFCQACVLGQFLNEESLQLTCKACNAGTFANVTQSATCQQCPAGRSSNATNAVSLDSCNMCQVGMYAAEGSALCSVCRAGQFANSEGNSGCKKCVAGFYIDDDATEGAMSDHDNVNDCKNCLAGQYSASEGGASCTLCEGGLFTDQSEATGCQRCSAGRSSYVTGQTAACPVCTAGKWQNDTGQLSCNPCPSGKYLMDDGVSAEAHNAESKCLHCKLVVNSQVSATLNCTSDSDSRVSVCAAGHVKIDGGAADICTECSMGKVVDGKECKDCVVGRFVNFTRVCEDCNMGQYNDEPGQVTCKSCEASQVTIARIGGSVDCMADPQKTQLEDEKAQLIVWNLTLTDKILNLTATKDALFGENNELLVRIEELRAWNSTLIANNGALLTENIELLLRKEELRRELEYSQSNFSTKNVVLATTLNELEQMKRELALEKSSGDKKKPGEEEKSSAGGDCGGDKKKAGESELTTPTDDNDDDGAASVSHTVTAPAPAPTPTPTPTSISSTIKAVAKLEQHNKELEGTVARQEEIVMALSGLLVFCFAMFISLCCCRLMRKKAPAPAVISSDPRQAPPPPPPKPVGKFGQFMDRNHDAIKKIGHHDHAVSVQKISRVHSRRKVEKIQKNQFHAKGRLMARLKKRAEASHMATEAKKVVGTGSSTLILPKAFISEKEQKKAEKKLEKQKRKAEKKAQKRASKIAAKKEKKRKNSLKKEEEENVEKDVVVRVLEESMAPKRSYSEV